MLLPVCLSAADSLNTMFTAKTTKSGNTQSPFDILFNSGSNQQKLEGERGREEEDLTVEGGEYSEGEEDGEEEAGEGEREGERVLLEVISDSISQSTEAPVWQPPTTSTTVPSAQLKVNPVTELSV